MRQGKVHVFVYSVSFPSSLYRNLIFVKGKRLIFNIYLFFGFNHEKKKLVLIIGNQIFISHVYKPERQSSLSLIE